MADGIKFDDLEMQAEFESSGLRFEFAAGGMQSLANWRGEDDVVPEASGRYPGQYIPDLREVALHGLITGGGGGSAAQPNREAFRQNFELVLNKMQPNALITITVYPPNFGLAAGFIATLAQVRPLRIVGPEPTDLWYEGWEGDLQLVCIDSPPDWVVAEEGS